MRGMSQRQMQIQTELGQRCGVEMQCARTSKTAQRSVPPKSQSGATFSTAETDAQMPRNIQPIGHDPTEIRRHYYSYTLAILRPMRWWDLADFQHLRLHGGTPVLKRH